MRLALLLIAFAVAPVWVEAAAVEEISGTFDDGTHWLARKPENWNGTLLLDLDGAGFLARSEGSASQAKPVRRPNPFDDWLFEQGYALGGTTREPVGYDFPKAVDHLLEVRRLFAEKWGVPKRTIASGGSRGAFVVRLSLELYPGIFDGGIMYAGGGAGEIAVLNNKLHALFVLKTLVDPDSPLTIVDVVDVEKEMRALNELLAKATATPQGRARLALAAAVQQFALWVSRGKPKPNPTDYEAQLDQIAENFVFAMAIPVRAGVERVAGGNVSWNTDADYAQLLRRSGRTAMVEALYRKAGLSLEQDLRTLATAPRIRANPGAVRRAEGMLTYTGRIEDPLVNVDNDDPVDPASDKLAYIRTLQRAGRAHLFQLLWSDSAGHGGPTHLDRAVGFALLIRRLETGSWGDTSLPALRMLATEIKRATTVDLGETTLFDPGQLPEPASEWDVTHWGTYR